MPEEKLLPTVILTSKGRLTLPKSVLDRAGLRTGDRVTITVTDEGTILLRPGGRSVEGLFGALRREGQQAASIDEMDEAVEEYHRQKNERIRRDG